MRSVVLQFFPRQMLNGLDYMVYGTIWQEYIINNVGVNKTIFSGLRMSVYLYVVLISQNDLTPRNIQMTY